ncbi:MAG: hypothetical protein MEQ07_05845 [Aquimonas sp.]|nr:hypothetical protein [Aquimonas sp.]
MIGACCAGVLAAADQGFRDPFLAPEPSPAISKPTTGALPDIEAEPRLRAAELAPPALLAGPGFRVQPEAQAHGFLYQFKIETAHGVLLAQGLDMLEQRIDEMTALEALHAESVSAALLRSGADAAMAPLRAVAAVAQRPGEAVIGLPQGVFRYFSERIGRVGERARRLSARADQRISHEGSPFAGADAPMTAARVPRGDTEDNWFGDVGDEVVRLARSEAGYGRARRELSARLGVDPYTGNPLIRERLDRLAWAATAGRLGIDQTLGLLDPISGAVLSTATDINRLVLELPPEDLRARNSERLMRFVPGEDLRYDLLQFSRLSPSLQTRLVDLLGQLDPSAGAEHVLEFALMAGNEVEARFVVNTLQLLVDHLGARASGGRLAGVGALLAYDSADGERIFALPVDLLSWTEGAARWFEQPGLWDHPQRSLVVTGDISLTAQRALSRQGWSLFTQARRRPGVDPEA